MKNKTLWIALAIVCGLQIACANESSLKSSPPPASEENTGGIPIGNRILEVKSPQEPIALPYPVASDPLQKPTNANKSDSQVAQIAIGISYEEVQKGDPEFFGLLSFDRFRQILRIKQEILNGPKSADPQICKDWTKEKTTDIENLPRFLPDRFPVDFLASPTLPVTQKKQVFFCHLAPSLFVSNTNIIERRYHFIEALLLQKESKELLLDLVQEYGAESWLKTLSNEEIIDELLKRVLPIPSALAQIQAAKETGWAIDSKFSIVCNNHFSQVVSSGPVYPECIADRNPDRKLEKYRDILHSTEAYMLNVNSNKRYQELRDIRWQHYDTYMMNASILVDGLQHYAEDKEYVPVVKGMIRSNKSESYAPLFTPNKLEFVRRH